MLAPDFYVQDVFGMDLGLLTAQGVDTLLVDLDNTLLARNSGEVTHAARQWVARAKAAGFELCLVSNNWHERVSGVARDLDVELVAKAVKPLPFAFLIALRKLGSTRRRSATVGDQLFTDVLGGKLLGMKTVMVVPLSSSDLPHTIVLRKLERIVLAGRNPLP